MGGLKTEITCKDIFAILLSLVHDSAFKKHKHFNVKALFSASNQCCSVNRHTSDQKFLAPETAKRVPFQRIVQFRQRAGILTVTYLYLETRKTKTYQLICRGEIGNVLLMKNKARELSANVTLNLQHKQRPHYKCGF